MFFIREFVGLNQMETFINVNNVLQDRIFKIDCIKKNNSPKDSYVLYFFYDEDTLKYDYIIKSSSEIRHAIKRLEFSFTDLTRAAQSSAAQSASKLYEIFNCDSFSGENPTFSISISRSENCLTPQNITDKTSFITELLRINEGKAIILEKLG